MTRDDIIKLAREAGAGEPESLFGRTDYVVMTRSEVERFAALVADAELDGCCDLLEGMHVAGTGSHNYYLHAATELRRLRNARSTT